MLGMTLVGNDAVKHANHCVSETTRIPFFFAVTLMVIELDHIVRGGEPLLRRGMIATCSVNMVRHPQGSYIVILIAVSGVAAPGNKIFIGDVIHKQENRHKVPPSVLRAVLRRMQSILLATRRTPRGASRLVHAMSAWLVKTRRAPSRHSRDARVYGHTTTAMHKLSTPPLRPSTSEIGTWLLFLELCSPRRIWKVVAPSKTHRARPIR